MIYLFLAQGFEEIEALTPVDVLRRGKADVVTVGVGGRTVRGSHGIVVGADISDDEIKSFNGVEAVILPGGMPGTLNLEANATVQKAIRYCAENGLLIGAICAAPSILGHAGLLENRHAVCFPSFELELKGSIATDDFVCRDGNIITAKGMGVSLEFALKLLEALKGPETAEKVRTSLQCR